MNCARIAEGEQKKFMTPEILLTHLMKGIGIAFDLNGNRMFITDLGGSIYSAKLDGSDKKILLAAQGNLLGSHIMKPLKNMYEFSWVDKTNKIIKSYGANKEGGEDHIFQ
jgi:hypothetical protein